MDERHRLHFTDSGMRLSLVIRFRLHSSSGPQRAEWVFKQGHSTFRGVLRSHLWQCLIQGVHALDQGLPSYDWCSQTWPTICLRFIRIGTLICLRFTYGCVCITRAERRQPTRPVKPEIFPAFPFTIASLWTPTLDERTAHQSMAWTRTKNRIS